MPVVREIAPEIFDSPGLLGEGQERFLDEVHAEVLGGLRARHLPEDPELNRAVLRNVQVVREHLLTLVDAGFGEGAMRDFRHFCAAFPAWGEGPSSSRRASCDELRRTGNGLHQHRRNCNISRVVSNSASALGGGALVGGAVLTVLTGPAAPFLIAGAAMVVAGSAAAVGTSVAETIITKVDVDKANRVIQADKQRSAELGPWLVRSAQMETAMEAIRDIDVAGDILTALMGVVRDAVDLYLGNNAKAYARTVAQAVLAVAPAAMGGAVNAFALLVDALVLVVLMRQRNALVCDLSALTYRIVLSFVATLDGATDLGLSVAALVAGGGAVVGRQVGRAVARGTLAVLSIVLDVSLIIMSAIDLSKGSRSEIGDKMIKLADQMELQREKVQEVYEELMRAQGNAS